MQKEGFKLMIYQCKFGHVEIIWNSRDGITPFIVSCAHVETLLGKCTGEMQHICWPADLHAPDHVPAVGSRVFVDLTIEKAREYRRRYVDEWWDKTGGGAPSMKNSGNWQTREDAIEALAKADVDSFAPHTPDLVVVDHTLHLEFLARVAVKAAGAAAVRS